LDDGDCSRGFSLKINYLLIKKVGESHFGYKRRGKGRMKGMIGERNVTLPNCGLTDYLVWSWV
jgi:hypothetical protein